jgi:ribosome biogenesis GTPase
MFPARVAVSYGSSAIVWSEQGEFSAAVAGRLKLGREELGAQGPPVVGDWVAIRPAGAGGRPMIHGILPRNTAFVRKVAGLRAKPQVVAANIDRTLIMTSANRDFNPRRLERYITLARESGAAPLVVLSKGDLAGEDLPEYVQAAHETAAGVPVLTVCGTTGEGAEELRPYLGPGTTVALLGSSGVGKSTLINFLLGEERLRTNEVREDERGRHTTTTRELLMLPTGALVIDTPGMRELQLWEGAEGLEEAFADVMELAAACRFGNCRHENEPGCAVQTAIETGQLDEDRLDSYRVLSAEIAAANQKQRRRR